MEIQLYYRKLPISSWLRNLPLGLPKEPCCRWCRRCILYLARWIIETLRPRTCTFWPCHFSLVFHLSSLYRPQRTKQDIGSVSTTPSREAALHQATTWRIHHMRPPRRLVARMDATHVPCRVPTPSVRPFFLLSL